MLLNPKIKYFTIKQNLTFVLCSSLIIWSWMFIASFIDRGNDRGLITIIGIIALTSLNFSLFLSEKKLDNFVMALLLLLTSILLIFILSFTLGLYIQSLTALSWCGFIVPIVASGILIFLNIRRFISFPNNKIAFWSIFSIPTIMVFIISSMPFYDGVFAHDFGIGFLISIYLTSTFITIGILCRFKKTTHK